MHVLIKIDANWADEINFEGFTVWKKADWEEFQHDIKKYFDENPNAELELGIGTNEEVQYSSYNKVMRELTAVEITEEEKATLKKVFGNGYSESVYYGSPACHLPGRIWERISDARS